METGRARLDCARPCAHLLPPQPIPGALPDLPADAGRRWRGRRPSGTVAPPGRRIRIAGNGRPSSRRRGGPGRQRTRGHGDSCRRGGAPAGQPRRARRSRRIPMRAAAGASRLPGRPGPGRRAGLRSRPPEHPGQRSARAVRRSRRRSRPRARDAPGDAGLLSVAAGGGRRSVRRHPLRVAGLGAGRDPRPVRRPPRTADQP